MSMLPRMPVSEPSCPAGRLSKSERASNDGPKLAIRKGSLDDLHQVLKKRLDHLHEPVVGELRLGGRQFHRTVGQEDGPVGRSQSLLGGQVAAQVSVRRAVGER